MNKQNKPNAESDIPSDAQWLAADLRDWANSTMSAPPADMDSLRNRIESERVIALEPRRSWAPPRLAWNLAAAALFLFAFTQVSFTVRRGETEWSWGRQVIPAPDSSNQLVNLQTSVENLAYTLNEHQAWLTSLAEADSQIKLSTAQTHTQLANWQKLESETRYADDEKLIALIQAQSGNYNNVQSIANLTN
jgi:hypothetical protein